MLRETKRAGPSHHERCEEAAESVKRQRKKEETPGQNPLGWFLWEGTGKAADEVKIGCSE